MHNINQSRKLPFCAVWSLRLSVIYLMIGLLFGLGMAISGNHLLRPVHAHVLLLGWAALGMVGIVYCVLPHLAQSRLASWHFWLHNTGLPIMMVALGLYHLGHKSVEPLIGVGSIAVITALALFSVRLMRNIED